MATTSTERVRIDKRQAENLASDGIRQLGHLSHLLTALLIEHGPMSVSHEKIGMAALRYEVVVHDDPDGVTLAVVKRGPETMPDDD